MTPNLLLLRPDESRSYSESVVRSYQLLAENALPKIVVGVSESLPLVIRGVDHAECAGR